MAEATRTVRVQVHGRVQMVWFRAWTQQRALALGLSGWVRNADDGSVEAVFKGRADRVEKMIRACHEGPPMAEVQTVEVSDHSDPVSPGFVVR
jgi:acylphosphatase